MGAIAAWAIRFRLLVVAMWTVAATGSVFVLPGLSSVSASGQNGFLPDNAPSVQAAKLVSSFAKPAEHAVLTVVVARADRSLDAADVRTVNGVLQRVRRIQHVTSIRDLGTSPDARAVEVQIQTDVPATPTPAGVVLITRIRDQLAGARAPPNLGLHLTGSLASVADQERAQSRSEVKTTVLALLVSTLLLVVGLRAVVAPLVIVFSAGVALGISSPLISAISHLGVQASSIARLVQIVLIVGVTANGGLLVTTHLREEMRRGGDSHGAAVRAMAGIGTAVTVGHVLLLASLLALLTAQFGFYRGLGPPLAIGVAVSLLAVLTLIPPLLAALGHKAFWPTSVAGRLEYPRRPPTRATSALTSQPLFTIALGVVTLVALAMGALGAGTIGFADQSAGPPNTDSTAANTAIKAHYPAAATSPTTLIFVFNEPVWGQPVRLATVNRNLRRSQDFTYLVGPLNPGGAGLTGAQLARLHKELGPAESLAAKPAATIKTPVAQYSAYRETAKYISPDGKTVQFSSLLRRNNAADPAALAAVPLVRQHVERIARAADAKASGMVGVLTFAYDVGHAADVDRTRLVPAVAAITALLLGLAIRSVVVPLYLVVTALLSAVSAVGATALVLVHLMGQRGTHFVVPLLIFLFVLTLGAGHGLVVVRMVREKAVEMPLRDAVTSALDETWTTVALGGAVLAASFIALAVGASDTSASAQIQQLGWGVAAALMLDVVVMRLAVVPAIIVVLGRWNWWPAAPVSASFAGAPAQPAWQQAASGPYPTARPGYPPGPAYPPSPPTGPGPLSPPAPGAPPDDRPGGYPRPPRQPG